MAGNGIKVNQMIKVEMLFRKVRDKIHCDQIGYRTVLKLHDESKMKKKYLVTQELLISSRMSKCL